MKENKFEKREDFEKVFEDTLKLLGGSVDIKGGLGCENNPNTDKLSNFRGMHFRYTLLLLA